MPSHRQSPRPPSLLSVNQPALAAPSQSSQSAHNHSYRTPANSRPQPMPLFDVSLEEAFEVRNDAGPSNITALPKHEASRPHIYPSQPNSTSTSFPPRISVNSPLHGSKTTTPAPAPAFHRFHSHIISGPSPLEDHRRPWSIWTLIKPWIPFLLWVVTSLGFVLAITVYRTELFQGLDDLSHYLQQEGSYGEIIIFLCIFITTFPPLPLYSTFIILSGYTFGAWTGFLISFTAALSGAVVVYALSFWFLRGYLSDMLSQAGWMKRVVRSIERRPKLLFLIRVAPYPYNLLNALLAASPTLSFRTYFWCTALSLFKLIIHTTAGSTIHQFAEYHASEDEGKDGNLARTWYFIGIGLCVGIFIYLSILARRAVEDDSDPDDRDNYPYAALEGGPIGGEMTQVSSTTRN